MTKNHRPISADSVNHAVQSGTGRLLILCGFACFVLLALYPFDWDPPVRVENAASFNDNGNLEFRKPGTLLGAKPPSWIQSVRESGSFSLRLRVRPFAVLPGEPDRIISLSKDHVVQSLMLGQDGEYLVLRLIGPDNDREKRLVKYMDGVFAAHEWRQIDLDIRDGRLQIRVDDAVVLDRDLPEKNRPHNWNRSHVLVVGNENTGRRPWIGEIAEARIAVAGKERDVLRSDAMRMPAKFWSARYAPRLDSIIRFDISRNYYTDYIVNLVCFVPLGLLLAARRKRHWSVLYAALVCGSVSLGVEFVQIFFDRDPSIYDWMLNTGGGFIGAVFAGFLRQRRILVPYDRLAAVASS